MLFWGEKVNFQIFSIGLRIRIHEPPGLLTVGVSNGVQQVLDGVD